MSLPAKLDAWKAKGQFYEVPPLNLKVFAIDIGDTKAVADKTCLLVHGFPESSFSFHKVVDGLLSHFDRLVLIDMPGYGFSDKPSEEYSYSLVPQADVLFCVYQQLGVTGGHVICHDMGTSVVTEWLARYVNKQLPNWFSDSFRSVTFTNGSMVLGLAKLRIMQKLLLVKILGPIISQLASFSTFKSTVQSAHGGTHANALSDEDIDLLWQSCTLQDGHNKNHHIIRYLNDRRRFEATRWLPSLALASKSLPIHICWGDADQVATIEMARYLKASVCIEAKLTEMPGVGHFCQIASPDIWLNSVISFYQR